MQLLKKFQPYRDAFFEMLEKFESIWAGHLGRINIVKLCIDLTSKKVLPIHSASYRAGPAARKFSAVEIDRMLAEEIVKHAAPE